MSLGICDIVEQNVKSCIVCFTNVSNETASGFELHCKIDSCNSKYKSKSAAIRHVRLHHNDIFRVIESNRGKLQTDKFTGDVFNELLEIRVKVRPAEIRDACVDLITQNALPLCVVEFPAFQRILKPYIIALDRQNIKLVINRDNIKKAVEKRAKVIKQTIKRETKNKMVALMLDIASRYNRSVLGINIAYFNEETKRIRIRTVGMHVLKFSQSAVNIKEAVTENLRQFGIQLMQIISVTTDNGKNMLKTVADLHAEIQGSLLHDADDEECDEFIDESIFDEEYYNEMLLDLRTLFERSGFNANIHGIVCGAHCLHLVVTHALDKSAETKALIEKGRKLAKKLRTPTLRNLLQAFGLNAAKIDVCTRWNSIFSMVIIQSIETEYLLCEI